MTNPHEQGRHNVNEAESNAFITVVFMIMSALPATAQGSYRSIGYGGALFPKALMTIVETFVAQPMVLELGAPDDSALVVIENGKIRVVTW